MKEYFVDIKFFSSGRGKAQCKADPNFPNGKIIPPPPFHTGPICEVDLPYPAPECGYYIIRCSTCNISVAVTTAGRTDDPIKISLSCQIKSQGIV